MPGYVGGRILGSENLPVDDANEVLFGFGPLELL